jgi:hypothetical protein
MNTKLPKDITEINVIEKVELCLVRCYRSCYCDSADIKLTEKLNDIKHGI